MENFKKNKKRLYNADFVHINSIIDITNLIRTAIAKSNKSLKQICNENNIPYAIALKQIYHPDFVNMNNIISTPLLLFFNSYFKLKLIRIENIDLKKKMKEYADEINNLFGEMYAFIENSK